jgi:hypothetical protein
MADDDRSRRIGELQDEIKVRDRRIEDLRREVDELRELNHRMAEHAEDYNNVIERWKEAFGMVQTESGGWTWEPFWNEWQQTIDNHSKLVRQWNSNVPLINRAINAIGNVGRPLAASEAQCATVLKLHKGGRSLRWIAEETSLSFSTVRTIVGKANGTDRTTKLHRARIDISGQMASWKRRRRTGDALPRRAQAVVEEGHKLIKEAKGLGRGLR